jgi:hypothetical protein
MFRSNLLGVALLFLGSTANCLYGQIAVCAMDRESRSCWSEYRNRPNDVTCPAIPCIGNSSSFWCQKQNPFNQAIQSVDMNQWDLPRPTMGPTLDAGNPNYGNGFMGVPTLFQCTIVRDCSVCLPDRDDQNVMKCTGWGGGYNNNLRLATWSFDQNLKRIKCPVFEN